MEIRRLRPEERFEADLISNTAFHMRMEDPDKARGKSLKETVDDWGAFDEGGHVMARIINNRFESVLDWKSFRTGPSWLLLTSSINRGKRNTPSSAFDLT